MANELAEKGSEKGSKKEKKERFQRIKGPIKKFARFIGRRHIWSGLLAGFLWAFSAPFLVTASPSVLDLPEAAKWILFFPLELSFWSTEWVPSSGFADISSWAIMVLTVSIFVGMFLGVVFTYSIHRVRVWRRMRNVSRTKPSE
jgi:ABC-type glycerol-3-phosphate transport system permease component